MGAWGYGIYDNDTFCEVVELFRNRVQEGMSVEDIKIKIQHEYENEVDSCIAALAVAESLWRLGKLTIKDIQNVVHIINEGLDCVYWMNLGADDKFIRNRRSALEDFVVHLSQKPTEENMWAFKSNAMDLKKGTCFWYKHRGTIYSAIVLEVMQTTVANFLIAVSENLDSIPQSISQILGASVYTIAWFGEVDLLRPKWVHIIGELCVTRNYKNKYGIQIEPGKAIRITNCGQAKTWAHSFRQVAFNDVAMRYFID